MILLIETSTKFCSVALSSFNRIYFHRESQHENAHAEELAAYADEALKLMHQMGRRLRAVAVSAGPGSYTGLRIGASLAKGLCFGYDVPLIGMPTLDILASAAQKKFPRKDCRYIPVLDTRGKEVYHGIYDHDLRVLGQTIPEIISEDTFADFLTAPEIFFLGNGAYKCRELYTLPNTHFCDDFVPTAVEMAAPAEKAFFRFEFSDVAYFEPIYFKDFVPTPPRNKLF
jgi:tRNA threonylcarbamoyladenosine biosynthesis protein TsaB